MGAHQLHLWSKRYDAISPNWIQHFKFVQSLRELLVLSLFVKELLQGIWSLRQYPASVPLPWSLSLNATGTGQDTMVDKVMLSKWFCSQVNLKLVSVVSDLRVPCHKQNSFSFWGLCPRRLNINSFTGHSTSDFWMEKELEKKKRSEKLKKINRQLICVNNQPVKKNKK